MKTLRPLMALTAWSLTGAAHAALVLDYYGKEASQLNELFVPALGADAIFSGVVNE